jgi:hypothetical protein
MTINGKNIYMESMEEINKLDEELRDTYEIPPMFDVG